MPVNIQLVWLPPWVGLAAQREELTEEAPQVLRRGPGHGDRDGVLSSAHGPVSVAHRDAAGPANTTTFAGSPVRGGAEGAVDGKGRGLVDAEDARVAVPLGVATTLANSRTFSGPNLSWMSSTTDIGMPKNAVVMVESAEPKKPKRTSAYGVFVR